MAKFLIRRVLMALVTVLIVATATLFLMHALPGNPWLGEKTPPQSAIDALNLKYGLDKPLPVQLVRYLGSVLRGDLGVSVRLMKNYPVRAIIAEMFPVSARIGFFALLWAVPAGVGLGCAAACRRGGAADVLAAGVSAVGMAAPEFVAAAVLLVLFTGSGPLPFFPTSFEAGDPASYLLPCLSLGLSPMCFLARQTRASMLDVLGQDYIRTALAKGLKPRRLLLGHTLRNALLPVAACLGPLSAFLLSGSFAVEQVFGIPGLGRYFTQSILSRDYPVIMGTAIFFSAVLSLANLAADLFSLLLDPRADCTKGGD